MPNLTDLKAGFFGVRLPSGRIFDVAISGGKILLASAHDGDSIPWAELGAGAGEWRNASPFELFAAPAEPTPRRTIKVPTIPEPDKSAEYALELCDSIDEMAEEMPGRAEDFTTSVLEKAADIRESVEQRGRATPGQITALENMVAGMSRWLER